MSDAGWPIQQAVYARLTATPWGLTVWDAVPQGAAFPYLTIDLPSATDWSATRMRGEETLVDVHAWSRYPGAKECRDLLAEAKEALHEARLVIAGQHLTLCTWVSTLGPWIDLDGETRHAVARFRLLTVAQPAT